VLGDKQYSQLVFEEKYRSVHRDSSSIYVCMYVKLTQAKVQERLVRGLRFSSALVLRKFQFLLATVSETATAYPY
jgi:hypothetical protein